MKSLVFALALASLVGAACAANVPLISRQLLFGNPDKASARISPDGSRLAYLAPLEGVLNVWVCPADRPEQARPITHDKGRGIRRFFWAFTNHHIIYIQDLNGDENWRIYAVNLQTGAVKDLTPLKGVNAEVENVSERVPGEILVGLNDRVPQLHDLYRVNIETGARKLLQRNPGFVGYLTDDDYRLRFAFRMNLDGSLEALRPEASGGWERALVIPEEDVMTTHPLGFDKTEQLLYLLDSRGRDTAALTRLDTRTGVTTEIVSDPEADISDALVHPTEKNVQAVATTYLRTHWRILDLSIARDLHYLQTVARGDVLITSRSLDDRRWTVAFDTDSGPVRSYLYDRPTRTAKFLFTNRKAWEGLSFSRMRPVVIASRDGLKLVSYLTLPAGCETDATGTPAHRVPLVLNVHGGPWARDSWGMDTIHQWLANRGYAVLSVNYRGSTGFGKAFVNASAREWGGKMHDDLIDAVNWAISRKVADPNRIAIFGGSYGGYATLVGMTFTPEVFVAGVDLVGPSNLVSFLQTTPPYWLPVVNMMKRRVGDFTTEEGRQFLTSRSPLTYVDRIKRPLLIGQGANDPRVNKAEAEQIVKAMQERKIPVTYLLYSDEGHGFARPENNLSFFAVMEAFLAKYLGGRCEPIGNDFKGSSAKVITGAEQVPGLEAVGR